MKTLSHRYLSRRRSVGAAAALFAMLLWPTHAQASIFKGEALDKMADVLTWIVLVVAPIVGVGVFLIIHILPEKIAEKKQHPQTRAIQCLCLLSLFFGGLLWPLAWLWAYTKPTLYKMAYGTDKVPHDHDDAVAVDPAIELKQLRLRVAELETNLERKNAAEKVKV